MMIRELTGDEIREVYRHDICRDFPRNEIRPLSMIMKLFSKGRYMCIGGFDDEGSRLLSYAFFLFEGRACLLDYFAVIPEVRGQGIGSSFLRKVLGSSDADIMLIEVEDPEEADSPDEESIRLRRLAFYNKVGCINTEVRVRTFGADYVILEYPSGPAHTYEETVSAYEDSYLSVIPKLLYRKNILIKQPDQNNSASSDIEDTLS